MAKTMKKKRFDEGGVLRTRSDDEIGDTDPRTGIVTPGSFDRRRAQGEKNLQSLKSLFGMGSREPDGESVAPTDRFPTPMPQPAPAIPAAPSADSAMNQSIREAISKRPTSMSPNTSQGQDRSVTPSVIPSSPANPPAPKKKPLTPKPSVQPSRGGAGRGGPTAQQLQDYAKQKDAQRKVDYDKANKEAATPAGKAKRSEREKAEAITPDSDVFVPIPGGGALSAAAKLAKKLARMGKKTKSTAPFMKEIGNEPLKLGMNRGGSVKKMASGGLTGNASKRADGIAQRGKTKCKTY